MKSTVFTVVSLALLLGGCSRAPDATPPANEPAGAAPAATAPAKAAAAAGTINGIDAAGGMITLTHGPVDSLGWPAMTMPFKATPEQIASVKVGQKVRFEFEAQGMNGTITKITAEQ